MDLTELQSQLKDHELLDLAIQIDKDVKLYFAERSPLVWNRIKENSQPLIDAFADSDNDILKIAAAEFKNKVPNINALADHDKPFLKEITIATVAIADEISKKTEHTLAEKIQLLSFFAPETALPANISERFKNLKDAVLTAKDGTVPNKNWLDNYAYLNNWANQALKIFSDESSLLVILARYKSLTNKYNALYQYTDAGENHALFSTDHKDNREWLHRSTIDLEQSIQSITRSAQKLATLTDHFCKPPYIAKCTNVLASMLKAEEPKEPRNPNDLSKSQQQALILADFLLQTDQLSNKNLIEITKIRAKIDKPGISDKKANKQFKTLRKFYTKFWETTQQNVYGVPDKKLSGVTKQVSARETIISIRHCKDKIQELNRILQQPTEKQLNEYQTYIDEYEKQKEELSSLLDDMQKKYIALGANLASFNYSSKQQNAIRKKREAIAIRIDIVDQLITQQEQFLETLDANGKPTDYYYILPKDGVSLSSSKYPYSKFTKESLTEYSFTATKHGKSGAPILFKVYRDEQTKKTTGHSATLAPYNSGTKQRRSAPQLAEALIQNSQTENIWITDYSGKNKSNTQKIAIETAAVYCFYHFDELPLDKKGALDKTPVAVKLKARIQSTNRYDFHFEDHMSKIIKKMKQYEEEKSIAEKKAPKTLRSFERTPEIKKPEIPEELIVPTLARAHKKM